MYIISAFLFAAFLIHVTWLQEHYFSNVEKFPAIDKVNPTISVLKSINTENTTLMSFDIKYIRQDNKQCRNGKACRDGRMCSWSSLINFISKDTYVVLYLSCIVSIFNGEKTAKEMKSRQFCSNLLTSQMSYDVNRWRNLANLNVITVNVNFSQTSSEVASEGIAW